jgi:hypothetical protein
MNNVLIVMYSRTGTSQRIATSLSRQHRWPLGEVRDAEVPAERHRGVLQCLMDSWRRREPPIHYDGPPPGDFDIVVTISPIWANRMASPMRSFLSENRPHLRQLAVVSVMRGSGARHALAEATRLTNRRPLAHLAVTRRDLANGGADAMLASFSARVGAWEPSQAAANSHAWLAPRP